MKKEIEVLSPISHILIRIMAGLFSVLGLVLFFAPDWAVTNFPWKISPFVAMTMGGWYLGSAFIAWDCARIWRWSRIFAELVLLWLFSLFEIVVLIFHREALRFDTAMAWLYLLSIGVAAITAVTGIVDFIRLRPVLISEGTPVGLLMKMGMVIFIAVVLFISVVPLMGASVALNGKIIPDKLTLFTAHSFGAFYLAIALSPLPLLWAKGMTPILQLERGGLALIIAILAAALVNLDKFDFANRPGGLIYLGAYLTVFIVILATLVYFRKRTSADPTSPEPASLIGWLEN